MKLMKEIGILILIASAIIGFVLYDVCMYREMSKEQYCIDLSS